MMTRLQHYLMLLASLLIGTTALAQSTRPAPVAGKTENQPIIASGAAGTKTPAPGSPTSVTAAPALDMSRVVLALAIVLGLIFLLRWAGRKFFPGAGVPRSGGAMKVLSRLIVSPKQQLLMIQVGQRIVVVGDAGGQMSALTEITDPEEAASLVAQLSAEKSIQSAKGFGALFHRTEAKFDADIDAESHRPLRAELPLENATTEESAVRNARGEINELADKVRLLSAQFRQ